MWGRVLFGLTQRITGSGSLKRFEEIHSAPYVSTEQAQADQFRLLSELLNHAEHHVPYYREMFRSLGIKSRDIRSLKDFASLPILTKDIIRQRQRDLIREDVPIESLLPHHSGGSTGVPLTFYRDRDYVDISDAGTLRNLSQCGWKPGEMIAFFWGGNDRMYAMSRLGFELRQILRRKYQFDPFHSGPEEMDRWADRWKTLRPAVILGYASTVARFAQHLLDTGRTPPPLRGAFTTAEKLYSKQREVISRAFSCQVFDCYGSSEVQNIAAECPQGKMHVNTDFVVLEVDRSTGGADGSGPFLLTSLRNRSMPFIRYRNEDRGALMDGVCGCANHFPLLKLQIGRSSDDFYLPGGRVVHGEFFTHLMYGSEGISSFQFHQTAPDSITLWVIPGPGDPAKRNQAFKETIRQIQTLAPNVQVHISETDSIPLSSAGKHRFTRSDVDPQRTADN